MANTRLANTAPDREVPYTAGPGHRPDPDQLRARIPGWGADLDPADRPSVPQETDLVTGAHWSFPARQEAGAGRERSVEHGMLTPVFGSTVPLRGVSGAVRRYAYDRFSEGRTRRWLLLIAGDRIDVVESGVRRLVGRMRARATEPER
jgi:hypothetical protein